MSEDQITSPNVLRRFGGLTGLRLAGVVVLLAGALAFPVLFPSPVITNYGVFALIFVAVASAWNFFSGFSGYISLGNAVFFGSGAYTLGIAAYALIQADPFAITYLIFAVTGLTGTVAGPIPYSTVISQWFDRQRGLALGIGMAGVGIGVALMPQLAELLIAAFGWRLAYIGMAVAVVIFAFVPVALFVREPPDFAARPARGQSRGAALNLPGSGVGEALRSSLFWGLGIAFFLDVIAINGTLTHIVALLTDRGIARGVAVTALSGTGIALLAGRILSGWFLDRFWGPYVAIGFFVTPMIGLALLMSHAAGAAPFLGAICLGIGIGAEIDLMAFFASRYFGLRNYAKIYGTMFGMFGLGVGFGPALSGFSFDRFHSYTPIFVVYEIMLLVTCVIFLRLKPYPYPAGAHASAGAAMRAAA